MQQVMLASQAPAPGSDVAEATATAHWDVEVLSGSFAGMSTQPSLEAYSSGIPSVNMSGTEDTGSNTPLTLVPMAHCILKQSSAASEQAEQQLDSPTGRRRLFFAQAGPECTEEHLRAVFSPYGVVEQLQLFQESGSVPGGGCCGYVTLGSHEQAAAALAALQHGPQLPPPVGCLSVSWALPEQEQQQQSVSASQQTSLSANAGRTVFFAKVPPSALASEVEQLFGSFGKLSEVNLFRAWAGAKHSKGCGLITFVDRQSAGNAIAQLHGKYVFPGSDCPMVVEWMDLKKQRPIAPAPTMDKPPLGCSCDAYKLLLANVPSTTSENDLALLLGQFGRVVQVTLSPDSNGVTSSGHIWYATKLGAEALTNRVRSEPLWLRDPRTQQDLPLSVKKARRPGAPGAAPQSGTNAMFGLRPGNNNACSAVSGSSNSSSSLLPVLCIPGDSSGQLLQMQQACGGLGMLSPDVIRLLPMQQVSDRLGMGSTAAAAAGFAAGPGGCGGGVSAPLMAVDMCEAVLDLYEASGLGLPMPVHLQPAVAAQMASNLSLHQHVQPQQQRVINSQMCCLPSSMLTATSGNHAMSSPANIVGLNDFEGSFNMSLKPQSLVAGGGASSLGNNNRGSLQQQQQQSQVMTLAHIAPSQQQQQQQQLAAVVAGGLIWQQQQAQQQQQASHAQQAAQAQMLVLPHSAAASQVHMNAMTMAPSGQQQVAIARNGSLPNSTDAGYKSIAVPVEASEVQLIAENLSFFASHSGAQVTISSLPGAGLAVMMSGSSNQVAMAQSLLAAALASRH